MRAVRVEEFGAPEVLRLCDVPDPLPPGPGEVLVRLHAIGVNPVETYVREGAYPVLPDLPYTPGTDGAGVVEAVGGGVRETVPGDRVYTSGSITGTYAELAVCLHHHVHLLPSAIDFGQGAAVGVPYATAYRALFQRGGAQAGEAVLVHGASGGVGVAAVQLGVDAGMTVFGTAGSSRGRRLARTQGAGHVLDHTVDGYREGLLALTGGRGFDLIVEMRAGVNLGADLHLLAPRGRVVVVGSRSTIEVDPRELMVRDAAVLGMMLPNATPDELAAAHEAIGHGLNDGSLRPVVDRRVPLQDAAGAHRALADGGRAGKVVLDV